MNGGSVVRDHRRQDGRCIGAALAAVPLALVVLAAFLPALDNGFVNWDDDKNLLDNPHLRRGGPAALAWAWTTTWLGVYQPIAWMLFLAQHAAFGLDPRGYHLTSLALHAADAVALYALTLALLSRARRGPDPADPRGDRAAAATAAALFAAHPLRAEAVAWASCQPYLPCALFAMFAVLAYLHAADGGDRGRAWLAGSWALFVAALLCHATAVGLPAVLLVLDAYPLRRLGDRPGAARRALVEKVPFFVASAAFAVVAIAARRRALLATEQRGPLAAAAEAGYAIWFYLARTAVPRHLAAVYPAPPPWAWPAVAGLAATAGVSLWLYLSRRRRPGLLAAWLAYLAILAPNLGLVRISEQVAADRYSYLATAGWAAVAAAGLRRRGVAALAVGLVAVAALVPLSRAQCRVWRDSEALWSHALGHGAARSTVAHYNLGLVLQRQGKLEAAFDHYTEALRLDPGDAEANNNLGVLLERRGRFAEAAGRFADAIRRQPDYVDAHFNLAIVLSRLGNFAAAAEHNARVLRLRPGFAAAHHNLGVDLFRQGRYAEAIAHYNEALRLQPGRVDTHNNLGVVLSRVGKLEEAAAHHAAAIKEVSSLATVPGRAGPLR